MNGIHLIWSALSRQSLVRLQFLNQVHPVCRGGVTSVVRLVYDRRITAEKLRSLSSWIALSRPKALRLVSFALGT